MPGAPPLRATASQATVAFSRVTIHSIRSSCMAFCGESRVRSLLVAHFPGWPQLLRWGLGSQVRGGDRRCRAPPFRAARAGSFRFSLSFALSLFGPSHRNAFSFLRSSTAAMAFADFPAPLSAKIPPAQGLFFHSCLWALEKAVNDRRASRVLACPPADFCLTAHVCCFGRTWAGPPFAPAPCGADLAVRLRLSSRPRRDRFIPRDQSPAGHTSTVGPQPQRVCRRQAAATGDRSRSSVVGASAALGLCG
jgi:hypothetical protein